MTRCSALAMPLAALFALALPPARDAAAQGGTASPPRIAVLPFDFAAPVDAPRSPVPPRRWMLPGVVRPAGGLLSTAAVPPPSLAQTRSRAPAAAPDDGDLTSGIGAGVADLLVERLVAEGRFRVLERRHLDAVRAELAIDPASAAPRHLAGADYVVTGSVVGFGGEDRQVLGGLGGVGGLGGLGFRRRTTRVALVARVVDAASGEVVFSLRGEGVSHKGSGLTLGAIAKGTGGIVSVGSSAFRESALGEATERAVAQLAERLTERRVALGGQ